MKRKRTINFLPAAVLFFAAAMSMVSCKGQKEETAFVGKIAKQSREISRKEAAEGGEAEAKEEDGLTDFSEAETEAEYPLVSWDAESNYLERDDYISLQNMDKEKSCRVKAGDTLWKMAEELYGTGEAWTVLMEANDEQIRDENLILPGMELSVPESCFIRKQSFSRGGFSSSACSYDVPWNWVAGRPNWEICLEYSWYPEEGNYGVYTHVTQNRLFPEGTGDAWESIQQKIIEISEESTEISFSLPVFERYRRTDGSELLFYQFVAKAGENSARFAVAYVPGEKYLAEFIGICPLVASGKEEICDIAGITRYMAASYREEGGEKEWDSLKYRPYLGADSWPFEDLHNPFAIAAERFGIKEDEEYTGEDGEVSFVSGEWEELLRRMVCYHFSYSDRQRKEFMERPVYLSELAWIHEVKLIESPIPGRDQVVIEGLCPPEAGCADYNLTTLSDIAVLPGLQKLTLEIGTATDYEALAGCPSLKELSIAGQREITDPKWLLELPNLEALTFNVSYIPHLLAMGVQMEDGTTFSGEEEETQANAPGTVEEILAECTSLTYLELEYTQEMDFGFLEELPELYAFILKGGEEDGTGRNYFTEKSCPHISCLVVDGSWIRNPA